MSSKISKGPIKIFGICDNTCCTLPHFRISKCICYFFGSYSGNSSSLCAKIKIYLNVLAFLLFGRYFDTVRVELHRNLPPTVPIWHKFPFTHASFLFVSVLGSQKIEGKPWVKPKITPEEGKMIFIFLCPASLIDMEYFLFINLCRSYICLLNCQRLYELFSCFWTLFRELFYFLSSSM